MPNLIGNPTEFGEQLYTQNLLTNIKKFVLIGSVLLTDEVLSDKLNGLNLTYAEIQENILVELDIPYAGHDANGQAYFDCIVPYDLNLEKYIFSVGLIYEESDGTKHLADWAIVNKLYQTLQVGGTYKYLIAVTGEKGGVIFKNSDFITESELENYIAKNSLLLEGKNIDEIKEYIVGDNSDLSTPSIINPPTISIIENTAIIGYSTDPNYDGSHDKTIIKLYSDENRTVLLKEYTVTSGDISSIPLSDIPANTQLWGTLQVGSDNHLSDVVEFEFTSMNDSIESPVFTVETDNGKAVNLADVTLNALPTATNCTIDTVEMQIIKVSDGTVIDTQSTTDLTLPIVFESQNLVENTEYKWEVRCRDTVLNLDGAYSVEYMTTVESFTLVEYIEYAIEDISSISNADLIDNLFSKFSSILSIQLENYLGDLTDKVIFDNADANDFRFDRTVTHCTTNKSINGNDGKKVTFNFTGMGSICGYGYSLILFDGTYTNGLFQGCDCTSTCMYYKPRYYWKDTTPYETSCHTSGYKIKIIVEGIKA